MASKAELKAKLSLNSSLFRAGLKGSLGAAKSFASSIGSTLKNIVTGPLAIIGAALAGVFAVKNFIGGIQGAIQAGAAMQTLSEQTGVTVGSLKTLGYAFKEAGVDSEMVAGAVGKMQKTLFEASKGSAGAEAALGLLHFRIKDLIGLDPEEQFRAIGTAIDGITDPTGRAGAAMAIFGRQGRELLPVFANLKNLDFEDLHESAAVLQENGAAFREIAVGFGRAFGSLKGIYLGVASELVDPLLDLLHSLPKISFVSIGKSIGKALSDAFYFVKGFVTHFGDAMANLGGIAMDVAGAIKIAFVGTMREIGESLEDAFSSAIVSIAGSLKELFSMFSGTTLLDSLLGIPIDQFLGQLNSPGHKSRQGPKDDYMKRAASILESSGHSLKNVADLLMRAGGKMDKLPEVVVRGTTNWRLRGQFAHEHYRDNIRGQLGSLTMLGLGPTMAHGFKGKGLNIQDSSLERGAFGGTSLLKRKEILDFHNAAVAAGSETRPNNMVRRGDHHRQREFLKNQERARLKGESGVEKSNELLSTIVTQNDKYWGEASGN